MSQRIAFGIFVRAAAALLPLLAVACGDDGPTADDVCTRRAQVVCAGRNTCSAGFAIQRDYGTLAECEAREKLACVESVERTGSGNTPAYAETCTKATDADQKARMCQPRATPLAACESAVGAFKNGAACLSSNQCASSYCNIPPGQPCGTCAAKVAEGVACDSDSDCVENHYCKREPMVVMGTCTRLGAEGAVCNDVLRCNGGEGLTCAGFIRSSTAPIDGACRARTVAADGVCDTVTTLCNQGLQCVGSRVRGVAGVLDVTPGTCKPLKKVENDPCDRNGRMDADCDAAIGLYCHHVRTEDAMATAGFVESPTGTCKKRVFVTTGNACGTDTDGTAKSCQGGDVCQRSLDPITGRADTNMPGICVKQSTDGGPCNTDTNIGPSCAAGHACVLTAPGTSTAGTCRKRNFEALCKK